jgi:hypothetical protein
VVEKPTPTQTAQTTIDRGGPMLMLYMMGLPPVIVVWWRSSRHQRSREMRDEEVAESDSDRGDN